MCVHLLLADQSPSDGAGSNCGCANVMGGIAAVGLFLFPCQKVKKIIIPLLIMAHLFETNKNITRPVATRKVCYMADVIPTNGCPVEEGVESEIN